MTASLIQNGHEKKREEEYKIGIQALKNSIQQYPSLAETSKIIVVENNGKRPTFLDDLGVDVVYTDTNMSDETNKGVKEIRDVLAVMDKYKLQDDDFIVKLTGRYEILPDSPFMKALAERGPNISALVRYGRFEDLVGRMTKVPWCLTGLIGLKAKYVRKIHYEKHLPKDIEEMWARTIHTIPDDEVIVLTRLGLKMSVADAPAITRGGGLRRAYKYKR